jgi:uncharacterized damage-inducible protein DinB
MNHFELNAVEVLCRHGAGILDQAHALIEQLEREACATFDFGQAVGPHLRHLMDHYQALLQALSSDHIVEYDQRHRGTAVQKDPAAAKQQLVQLRDALDALASGMPRAYPPDHAISTVFKSGLQGECEFKTASTLARELVFVSHHAVHHFAVMRRYCEMAGLSLDPNFGKAPATVAYEKQLAQPCA